MRSGLGATLYLLSTDSLISIFLKDWRYDLELEQKTELISDALEKLYGTPEPDTEENVLDCLILTVLSQNTNDVNRDKGFAILKERFPTWEDVLNADVEEIGDAIKIAGLHRQKSRTIKNFLTWLKAEYGELDLGVHPRDGNQRRNTTAVSAQRHRHQDCVRHTRLCLWT